MSKNRLKLSQSHSIQGRDDELNTLRNAWNDCHLAGAGCRVITVHGVSGSGKTTLCQHGFAKRKDGYMASGKFDQYASSGEPYSGISKALGDLARELQNQSQHDVLERCMKDECGILVGIVPELDQGAGTNQDINPRGEMTSESMSFASERISVALEAFFKEFCSPDRPLVLFFDDIQWSDRNSLTIIMNLAKNPEIHHLILLLGYRDGGEGAAELEPLESLVSTLPEAINIQLGNLDIKSVNALIADTLFVEEDESQDLASLVLRRTHGNPFFVLRFLEMLDRRDLLKRNFVGWKWNMDEVIAETEVSDNVVDVLARQVQSLPGKVQRLLMLASCLGFFFNVEIIQSLLEGGIALPLVDKPPHENGIPENVLFNGSEEVSFEDALELAIMEGLIEKANQLYKFSHDRIRQCAYELLPPGEDRNAVHYRIGRLVYESFLLDQDDRFLLLTVNQLNYGISQVRNEQEILLLIKLNLQAAKAVKEKSAIELANQYTREALKLIRPKHWDIAYDTAMELETFAAETEWSLGRAQDSERHVETVLKHSISLEDTMRARVVRLKLLANSQVTQAIAEARSLLKQLGHSVPPSITPFLIHEIMKTKRMLKRKSLEELSRKDLIQDDRALWSLRIFQLLFFYGWNSDPILSMMSIVRAVQLSIKYGYSEVTPSAFAGWGYMLACSGDLADACRFGDFAIAQIKSKNEMASTYATACFSTMFKKPSVINLDLLLQGYRAGLETGDVYRGSICIAIYADLYVSLSGLPLKPFAADMYRFGRSILACRQFELTNYVSTSLQLALILTGQANYLDISLDRTGDLLGGTVSQTPSPQAKLAALYKELFVRYILNAPIEQVFDEIQGLSKKRYDGAHFFNFFSTLLDGLAAFQLYRSLGRKRYHRIASKARNKLKTHVKNGSVDCVSMLALLQAEDKSLSSTRVDQVKPQFDAVISQFLKTGMTHFGAIANERAAEQMTRFGDAECAQDYIQRASELYYTFGATKKVEEMARIHSFLHVPSYLSEEGGVTRRGCQRFESAKDSYGVNTSAAHASRASVQ